ncbi:MAG: hypothetical protein NTNFB01_35750 [Nitrospira sp.]
MPPHDLDARRYNFFFTRKPQRMDTDFIETLQRGIAIVGGIGLLGFCLYLLKTHKGA